MPFRSFDVWREVFSFHTEQLRRRPALVPALCIPVLGDALHSILVRDTSHGTRADSRAALRAAWRLTPALAAMKLRLEARALLWGIVPLYGVIQGMRHRLYWGMASNVLAFEHLSGSAGVDRCRMLVEGDHLRVVLRTLVIVPTVLLAASIVGTILIAASLGVESPATIGVCVLAFVWTTVPASAAANTLLYRRLAALEAEAADLAAPDARTA